MAKSSANSRSAVPLPAGRAPAVQGETLAEYADRLAMRVALVAGVVIALVILLLNLQRSPVPFLGDGRGFGILAAYGTVAATLVGAGIAYALGTLQHNARTTPTHVRNWKLGVVPVALAYAAAAVAIAALSLQAVQMAFEGLALARLQAVLLGAGVGGAIVYGLTKQAALLNAERMIRTAVIILAAGVYLTAVRIDDPEWWRISFSYLGSWDSSAHRIFNVTLIVGGALLVVWTSLFAIDLDVLVRHGHGVQRWVYWMRIGLYWVAVALAFVGLFKTRSGTFNSFMHNFSAYSLAAILGVMMVGVRWALPKLKPEFLAFTWLMVGALAFTLISAALRFINTVGLEMVCFALGILWLQALVVNVHNTARRLEPASYPE